MEFFREFAESMDSDKDYKVSDVKKSISDIIKRESGISVNPRTINCHIYATIVNEKTSLQAQYDALSQQNIEQSRAFSTQLKGMEDDVQRVTHGCIDVAAAMEDEAQNLKTSSSEIAGVQAAEMFEKYSKMLRDLAESQKSVPIPTATLSFYSSKSPLLT